MIDTWVTGYNLDRPHQALDMAPPVDRFTTEPNRSQHEEPLLVLPADLELLDGQHEPQQSTQETAQQRARMPLDVLRLHEMGPSPQAEPVTVELDKTVPTSGNLSIRGQQLWLGPDRAGTPITLRITTHHLRVFLAGVLIKTVASKLTASDLHALVQAGQARLITAATSSHHQQTGVIEVDRTVSAVGYVALANKQHSVGYPLAGRRVTLRFDGRLMTVLDPAERTLLRTMPNPLTTRSVAYLRGARPAGPPPVPPTAGPITVERIVSSSGGIMITRQRVQLGRQHARKVVAVTLDEHTIHIHDGPNLLVTVPRTTTPEVTHRRAQHH
jgi:hypothetical protein